MSITNDLLRAALVLGAILSACSSPPRDQLKEDVRPPAVNHMSSVDAGSATDVFESLVAHGTYRTSGLFEEVTIAPYPSGAAVGSTISVWVSRAGAADYLRIDPAEKGSGASVPRGTVIVREVHDASGAVKKLTVMAKGPRGYNPEIGDWFWLVSSTDGKIAAEPDGGAPMVGRMPECHSCHLPRAADDFLFGVPAADKIEGHP